MLPCTLTIKRMMKRIKGVLFPEYFGMDGDLAAVTNDLASLINDQTIVETFVGQLPELRRLLVGDAEATAHNDPAVEDLGEVILCYPVMVAMINYRVANALLKLGVKTIPRIITELAHSATGIDIHPAAEIGEHFAIDHGTGVVIGATSVIGDNVMLYQGVTLGAKNFHYDPDGHPLDEPRHPILEDNVTVYSNTSILGRVRIGHDTIIGGNVWLTHDVPPGSRILQSKAIVQPLFSDGAGI